MRAADEDLRHGVAARSARSIILFAQFAVAAHVDLREGRRPCVSAAPWPRGNRGNSGWYRFRSSGIRSLVSCVQSGTIYMGVRTGATTRAKTSTSTWAAPARSSARAQVSTVAPEVSTSSISTSRRPATSAFLSGRHAEGALHVVGALGLGQADLLRRGAHALERISQHRYAGGVRQPASVADWLKRRAHSRRQCSGTGTRRRRREQLAPGARHPAAQHRREVEPVAVFEGVHQRAGDIVVAHRGAGAVVGRRIGDRLHRQDAGAGIVGERNAEPLAIRRLDERQLRPAGRTRPAPSARRARRTQRAGDSRWLREHRATSAALPAGPCKSGAGPLSPRRFPAPAHAASPRIDRLRRDSARSRMRGARTTVILVDRVAARLTARERLAARCCAALPQPGRGRSRHADRSAVRARACRPAATIGAPLDCGRARTAASGDAAAAASSPTRRRCRSRDGSLDLVVSALALQFVNDLPGTLVQIRRALKPDGLFLAALARRRHADRIARGLRRRPRAKSRAASRRASRRSPICANSARCCSAPASRCR